MQLPAIAAERANTTDSNIWHAAVPSTPTAADRASTARVATSAAMAAVSAAAAADTAADGSSEHEPAAAGRCSDACPTEPTPTSALATFPAAAAADPAAAETS
jgi:hypothetical protein